MRSLLLKLQSQILTRAAAPDLSDFRESARSSRAKERYSIYENAYWIRRTEAIAEDFDHVEAVLDPKDFRELIETFLRETPSRSWTLSEPGSSFPEFIRASSYGKSFPHLASVAQWDALRTEVFRASSAAPGIPERPFGVNPTARSYVLSSDDAEYLRKTFSIEPLIQDDSDDPKDSNGGDEPLLLVWRNDLAESDYELEERILFGRSAKVWKTIESGPTLEELETRLAELAYDADSAQNLFFALSSGGALRGAER